MAGIQFGFILPAEFRNPQHRPALVEYLNRALTLASGHFDSAWMIDHLQFGNHDVLESFTTLSYLSSQHPRLKFGTSVLCQSFRNPALLAKMGATLQLLSGGRFILGLGAGWHAEEHRAYGYDFPPAAVRVAQLEETLQIIRSLWVNEVTTIEGQHYRVVEARCQPRPDPVPPIMVGAFAPKMLRLAAQYADWWNVSSTGLSQYRAMATALEQHCRALGRDPAAIKKTWAGGCACAPTPDAAAALAAGWQEADNDEDFDFVGTPEQLIFQMQAFIELGVEYFMLDCGGFPELTTLEMLIAEVIPALKQAGTKQ